MHLKGCKKCQKACALIEVGLEYVTGKYGDGGKKSLESLNMFNIVIANPRRFPRI